MKKLFFEKNLSTFDFTTKVKLTLVGVQDALVTNKGCSLSVSRYAPAITTRRGLLIVLFIASNRQNFWTG